MVGATQFGAMRGFLVTFRWPPTRLLSSQFHNHGGYMHAKRAFFIVGNTLAALLIASSCADQPTPSTAVDSKERETATRARSAPSARAREHRVNGGIDMMEQLRLDGSVRRTAHLRDWL